ncbi:hypothetical protein QA649_37785 [Bradyrhizobium sp. CB1717]|uniref:hypothetical protein n=1 Tax=Bradyrhizobium sp. CB1717 TaxID=3039154 RepID=UPI0024B127AD|nr:hypothetical protein [Bradyrhizobium sp. CB1717]WFU23699.1 hypothetical protein QA649_37785 [Bradyrhizobium sp. CB1717]
MYDHLVSLSSNAECARPAARFCKSSCMIGMRSNSTPANVSSRNTSDNRILLRIEYSFLVVSEEPSSNAPSLPLFTRIARQGSAGELSKTLKMLVSS